MTKDEMGVNKIYLECFRKPILNSHPTAYDKTFPKKCPYVVLQ